MTSPGEKVIVVMPAYNAARTLEQTIASLPLSHVDEIVLVDDASSDETVATARGVAGRISVPLTVSQLSENQGYGGNQKECYRIALSRGASIIVMIHPDYQYDPKLVKHLVEFIRDGYVDVMLGSRIRSRSEALAGGMPLYKYISNRFLTLIQNLASGRNLSEWHTGMRAYRRAVLEATPFGRYSDDFIFDQQMLFGIIEKGFTIGDIPVPVRYFAEASSINFKRSAIYGCRTLFETAHFVARTNARVLRYAAAGAAGFLTNQLAYLLLLYGFGIWYLAAGALSFCAGGVTSFLLHKFWTFGGAQQHSARRQLASYLFLALVNLALTASLLALFVERAGLHKLTANILANAIVAIWSFFIYKKAVFKPRGAAPHLASKPAAFT